MNFIIKHIQLRYKEHRTMIIGTLHPNWFEWLFLFRRKKAVSFIGSGTVWHNYPDLKKVNWFVARQLSELELKFKTAKKILR